MDEDKEDVFEPDSYPWHTIREIKSKERGTPGPALVTANGMLPCGGVTEPRPLSYGNAGVRLHFQAPFELAGEQEAGPRDMERDGDAARPPQQHQHPHHPHHHQQRQQQQQQVGEAAAADSMEAHIGQKLRLIGDQFHGENLQQVGRKQTHLLTRTPHTAG
ncbi:hypothetical protein NHX12_020022 [Muraenolepis orangiensis]|uniref:Uncharacterized protein n=1 Tax=Muraenolepis orangiensis TaxID=630683 RepID=A0A9Q0EUN0_9TELE|nr:hypothetical protein NHX12_020022 [Muraenolepis orangiensis]